MHCPFSFYFNCEIEICLYFFPLYLRDMDAANFLVSYIASHICRLWGHIGASNLFISPNIPTNHIPSIRYYSPCHSALVLRSREQTVRSMKRIIGDCSYSFWRRCRWSNSSRRVTISVPYKYVY